MEIINCNTNIINLAKIKYITNINNKNIYIDNISIYIGNLTNFNSNKYINIINFDQIVFGYKIDIN